MARKKAHAERSGCPIACSLDIVGDHWTLLIIRDLMFKGLHEYKDLLGADEGISSNILTDRLKRLELRGIISSLGHPDSKKRKLYYLTSKGKDLIHVMMAIICWAEKHIPHLLSIPPEKKELLDNDPDAMVELTLKQLEQWEQAYGISV